MNKGDLRIYEFKETINFIFLVKWQIISEIKNRKFFETILESFSRPISSSNRDISSEMDVSIDFLLCPIFIQNIFQQHRSSQDIERNHVFKPNRLTLCNFKFLYFEYFLNSYTLNN